MSKLYTEEEIKRTFGFGMNKMKFDGFMNAMKPIELPTDDEIEDYADEFSLKYSKLGITEEEVSAFVTGMICMRNKIQGGNQ